MPMLDSKGNTILDQSGKPQLTPEEATAQAGQFNAAMKSGNAAEVEKLNPDFTLYNGALVPKSQVAQLTASGATVSNGQVNAQAPKFATPPAGALPGPQAIAQSVPNPTGVQQGGMANAGTASSINPLADQKKQTLANLQASGTPTAATLGQASQAISQNTPPQAPPPYNPVKADTVLAADQAHNQYIQDYNNYQSSANQTQTLAQTYQQMVSAAGIPALDTQLINMKAVMDGTEQDIRNEIQKVSGFATDSQVLALSNARNKTMIQNYNNLLQTRTDAQNNINTMIGLTKEDRAYALQQLDQKLNFDQQQMQFADKALSNAQDSLSTTAKQQGWDTVYRAAVASGDVNAIGKINSTMGQGFDLATMAQNDLNARNAALAKTTADQAQTAANLAKTNAEIANTKANTAKTNLETKQLGATGGTPPQSAYQIEGNKRIVQSVDELIPQINDSTAGFGGKITSFIPGTASYNFKAQLDTLKANIAFGALTQMREASKTGGALGQISDAEERLLSATLGALDPGQSPSILKSQMNKIRDSITRWNDAVSGNTNSNQVPSQVPSGNVSVISPDGQEGYIPQAQLQEALKSGYKQK